VDAFLQDLRFAVRTLSKSPVFSIVAVLCLTLGIATNTTIFSVTHAILLRPFDFEDPDRLVYLQEVRTRNDAQASLSYLNYLDWREQAKSFAAMGSVQGRSLAITEGEEPERLDGSAISASLFPMLGARPQIGRVFREDEDRPGGAPVVILSDEIWRRRYAADRSIIGRGISINGNPHTVVGVMQPRFKFPEDSDLWIPVAPVAWNEQRGWRGHTVFGRLAPGVSKEQANREVAEISQRLARQYGTEKEEWVGNAVELRDEFIPDDVKLIVLTMMGAVTFVLLIACANVANLMLARATGRQREIAIRAAIGAGRGRIVRQLLTESVVLALAAGLIAIPLTQFGLTLMDAGIPPEDAVPYYIDWYIDKTTLGYTALVSVLTGLVFGLAPALQAGRSQLQSALREGGRGTGQSAARNRVRSGLVIIEVALSLVLLVGASLFVRTFLTLQHADVGFDSRPIMTMRFFLAGTPYDSTAAKFLRVDDIVRRIEGLPGIQAATVSNLIPIDGGGSGGGLVVEGKDDANTEKPFFWWAGVTSHWFETLGVELVAGRKLSESESRDSVPYAVVNRTMATKFWPQGNALGSRFRIDGDSNRTWFTIVGVTKDIRHGSLDDNDEMPPSAYVPYKYLPVRNNGLMVRVQGDPSAATNAIRDAIRASDPGIPVFDVNSMDTVKRLSFWQYVLFSQMFSVFGGIALFLAAIGVYGVISYSVSQRTQEIGVRVALGAQRTHVLGMIVWHGVILAGIGIGLGLLGAFGVTRVVSSLLVGVSATDPLSFGLVSLFLTVVAAGASYIPARRATMVDPIVALRVE
jgi:putative ABC transport system permease protein